MTDIEKLQAIYDTEQNVRLSWFWDSGVYAKLGDSLNGWTSKQSFHTVKEAVDWLYAETVEKKKSVEHK